MKYNETSKIEYSAVALGNFDGLHAGHRSVLNKAKNYSLDNNIRAVALVFDVHPKTYFGERIGLLMTDSDKKKFIRDIGLETQTVSFDEFRDYSAEEFVQQVLKNKLNAKAVFCGFNSHFGKGGKADAIRAPAQAGGRSNSCLVMYVISSQLSCWSGCTARKRR